MPKFLSDGIFDGSSTDLIVDGNVGIGTASPSYKLDVSGSLNINANATNGIRFENDGSYTTLNADTVLRVKQRLEVWGGGTTGNSYLDVRNTSGVAQIRFNAHSDSYILTNLGIGTTSPDVKLDVHSSNVAAFFESSANEVPVSIIHTSSSISSIGFKGSTTTNEYRVRVGANGNDFIAYTSNTERLRILDNGNVGIGTTSPNAKLESEYQNDSTSAVSTATAVKSVIDNNNSVITTGKLFDGSYEISSGSGEINGNYTNATSVTLSSSEYDGDPPAVGMLLSSASGNQTIPAGTTITGVAGNTLTFSNPITANNNSQISYQSSVTDKWGLYINGEAKNYISGNVGIRTTSTNAPLEINGFNTTSGNGEGLRITRQNLSSQYIAINEADGSKHRIQAVGDKPLIISNSATTYGIQFDTAGSERLRIDSSGKVGIGTTSPAEKLEVEGGNILVDNGQIIIDRDTAGAALIWRESDSTTIAGQLRSYTNRGDIYLYKDGVKLTEISAGFDSFIPKLHVGGTSGTTTAVLEVTGNTIINDNSATYALAVDGPISTDQYIAFLGSGVSGTADMTIDVTSNVMTFTDVSGGGKAIFNVDNVGIGTTSPSSILAISNNAPTITAISTNNSSGLRYNVAGTAQTVHRFQYGGSTLMTIRNTGNVGIGTDSPAHKLHVVGTNNDPIIRAVRGNNTAQYLDIRGYQVLSQGNHLLLTADNAKEIWLGQESNTQRVVINSSGFVGIGTTNPQAGLHVNVDNFLLTNGNEKSIDIDPLAYIYKIGDIDSGESGSYMEIKSALGDTIFHNTNVGIGATDPAYLLDVNEDDNVLAFRVTGGGGGAPMASFVRDVGATGSQVNINAQSNFPQIQFINTGNTFSIGVDGANFKISDNTSIGTNDRITIDNTGNVGIGTTNPQHQLDVIGGWNDGIRISGQGTVNSFMDIKILNYVTQAEAASFTDSNHIYTTNPTSGTAFPFTEYGALVIEGRDNTNGGIALRTGSGSGQATRIAIRESGDVGIGTTSPARPLDVNGSARLSDGSSLEWGGTSANIAGSSSSDTLFFRTASTERARIDSSGNVGIGTTNPGAKLHVNGTSEFSERLLFNKTVNTGSLTPAFYRSHTGFSLTTDSNYQKMVCYGYNANNNPIFQVAAKGFASDVTTAWDNDAATRFTVLAGGNVGIGTTSPSEKLAVSGGNIEIGDNAVGRKIGFDVSDSISFNSTTIAQYGMSNAGNSETGGITYSGYFGQKFFTNGTQRMVIKRYGNVGIGTTDPQEKLHVQNYTTGESHQAMFKGGAVTVGDYSYISLNNGYGSEYNKEVRLAAVAELGASNKTGFAILTSPDSNGASGHERLRVTADGNVGIGTTSPTAKLDINDSSNDVSLTNTANYAINTGSAISARHYRNVNLETPQMEWSIGGSTDLNWKKLATIVINDANYAGFGAEVEITDFSGNYGSSMAQYGDVYRGGLSIFHRAGTGIEPKQGIITINNDIAPYIRIYKIAGSGNSSYQIQVKSPGNYRQINVKLEEGIGNQVASITPHANDTNGSTSGGTAYTPDTYTNGNQFKTAFPTVTANRGNILYRLGVVNTAPSYPLDVTGTIRATGDVIAYSDIRVKENIKTIDNALDKVKALRGVEYNKIDNSEKSVGVIAQEIEEVIPEVVREDDQGMKSVAYGNITAVLIEAIKEQQKQIDELKKQLDAFTK